MRATASDGSKVLLDGQPVETFLTADDEGGWVRISHEVVRRGKVDIEAGTPRANSDVLGKIEDEEILIEQDIDEAFPNRRKP